MDILEYRHLIASSTKIMEITDLITTGFVHVRKSQIQGLFKDMYQQIQGLNTEEEGVRNQQNLTLNCSKRNFIMRSDMNMQNQFNKMSVLNVKQFQKISKN